ncbi:ceramidase domain-containing protein [Nocardioides bigeumensis]|uniref:Ceramidase n=1 Tax=Nocardioides bigeumensis TaxID=433657 RepID=A0ABP5JY33_9ACTN
MTDRRAFVSAAATAVLSTGLLALAIGLDWLGPDVGRGSQFCEAARDGSVLQPANASSNVGFVVAGLVIGWEAQRRRLRIDGLTAAYACVVVLLGPGSAAMHATQSALGGWLDTTSMYLVASFAAAYALTRWWRRGALFFWQVFLLLVAACEVVGTADAVVPVFQTWGNVIFGALLVLAIVVEVLLWRRGAAHPELGRTRLAYGAAAAASIGLAFAIWNASQHGLCDPHSLLQGHAAWHLLCALAAYFLFRLWASESAARVAGNA